MHDPATAEVWQTAFGKEFGGMAQGDNKTGPKGTNAIFVMKHDKLAPKYYRLAKKSLSHILWLIIDLKKRIQIKSE